MRDKVDWALPISKSFSNTEVQISNYRMRTTISKLWVKWWRYQFTLSCFALSEYFECWADISGLYHLLVYANVYFLLLQLKLPWVLGRAKWLPLRHPLESWVCRWDLLVIFFSLREHPSFTLKVKLLSLIIQCDFLICNLDCEGHLGTFAKPVILF